MAERVHEAGREIARLRQALADAPRLDRELSAKAALAGNELPEPSEPGLRAELEQAQRTRAALEDALRQSGDRLLAKASEHAEAVADELDQELDDLAGKVRSALAAVTGALEELAGMNGQAAWARALARAGSRLISPFQIGRTDVFRDTLGEVATAGRAFEHELGAEAERRRETEAWAAEIEAQNAEFERERQAAATGKEER